jgi:hypothetical protein
VSNTAKGVGKFDAERRRSLRRPVLETFSCFVVLPEQGFFRLKVHDLSEDGIGFDLDIEDAPKFDTQVKTGDELEIRFHINQTLFIPLFVFVRRIDEKTQVRRIGAEFSKKRDSEFKAYLAFIQLVDRILDSLKIDPSAELSR